MRIREPRTTALIFSSGKMVCTGAKSEEDSRMAARKYARIVQKLGFQVKRELHCTTGDQCLKAGQSEAEKAVSFLLAA